MGGFPTAHLFLRAFLPVGMDVMGTAAYIICPQQDYHGDGAAVLFLSHRSFTFTPTLFSQGCESAG